VRGESSLSSADLGALDRLELELRKLPEVLAVGFEGPTEGSQVSDDAVITVHLFVSEGAQSDVVEQQALDLGRIHMERPLRVAIAPDQPAGRVATSAAPSRRRVELREVSLSAEGSGVQVDLAFEGMRVTGIGSAATLGGTVDATIDGLRDLGWLVPFSVASAARLTIGGTAAVVVHLTSAAGDRFGVGAAPVPQRAAAKATLHALNRWLDDPAHRPAGLRHPGGGR
jgi:hypothetical protein